MFGYNTLVFELAQTRREEPGATHFIGSLVLSTSPDSSVVGVSKLLVVDGQQRPTMPTLLLEALRDHLVETGDSGMERFGLPCGASSGADGGQLLGTVTYAYRRDDGRSLTMLLASGKGDGFISFAAATGAAYCLT